MVSLTREGDREYIWREPFSARSATTAGYFPFATCARRGLRKGTASAVRGHDRDSGVTVMRQTDVALLCQMGNQHRWIAPASSSRAARSRARGDVGTIVLKRPSPSSRAWSPSKGSMTDPQGELDDDEAIRRQSIVRVTQADLRAAFATYGPVSSADIVVDGSDGKSKGFGFIEMPWQAHAWRRFRG